MRSRIGAAVLAVFTFASRPSFADPILLVVDAKAVGAAKRVEAELVAAGFEVVTRTSEGITDRMAWADEARRANALATVRVREGQSGAELWIVDRMTGKTVLRDIGPAEARDELVLATKTTELLRASLLEVRTPGFRPAEMPVPKAAEALLPPPPKAPAPPPPFGLVSVGGGVVGAGDIGVLALVTGELRLRLHQLVSAGASASFPLTRGTLEGPEGSSTQSWGRALLHVDATPLGAERRFAPFAGVAVGIARFNTAGRASSAPYTSEENAVISTAFGGRVGVAVRLTSLLAVRPFVGLSAQLPQPKVRYAGRRAGAFAQPYVELGLALELVAW